MLCPKTSCLVNISVFVGPVLSSPNEKAKTEGLLTVPLAPHGGSLSLGHSRYPCIRRWLNNNNKKNQKTKMAHLDILSVSLKSSQDPPRLQ